MRSTPSVIWVVQYVGNIQWHQNIVNNALNSLPTNIGLVNIGVRRGARPVHNSFGDLR